MEAERQQNLPLGDVSAKASKPIRRDEIWGTSEGPSINRERSMAEWSLRWCTAFADGFSNQRSVLESFQTSPRTVEPLSLRCRIAH